MAQLAHPNPQVLRDHRGIGIAALIALALATAGAVLVLMLAVPGSDHHSSSATPVSPGARFDGGPDEGTRGTIAAQPSESAVVRFDGGPQEGSRGAQSISSPRGPRTGATRFDGGPDEGTRGPVN